MAPTLSPSLWISDSSASTEPLVGEHSCDVVVIGAGYTGLSAAITLARAGSSVIVIESHHVGFGASGRNAGHLTPTIGKDLPTLLMMYGTRTSTELVRLADQAISFTEALIADNDIDCDYVAEGNVIAGIHPGQVKRIRKAVDAAAKVGASVRMLETDELDARGLPRFVACGAIEEIGGVMNPGTYLLALRDLAVAAGAELHERSPATSINETPQRVEVTTDAGRVRASRGILATNAYTPALGLSTGRVVPMQDSQFVTEPLTPAQRERLGWTGGEGIYTAHESLENYRHTADGRLVGGSRYVSYRYGNGIAPDAAPTAFGKIEARFRDRFPELADLRMQGFWSGHVALNLNFLPFIGPASGRGALLAALGYCGHGLAMSGYLGDAVARMALGTGEAPACLADRRRIPFPPEPLRWVGVGLVNGATALVDRWHDGKATPRP